MTITIQPSSDGTIFIVACSCTVYFEKIENNDSMLLIPDALSSPSHPSAIRFAPSTRSSALFSGTLSLSGSFLSGPLICWQGSSSVLSDPFDANYAIFQNDDTALHLPTQSCREQRVEDVEVGSIERRVFFRYRYRSNSKGVGLFIGLLIGFVRRWNFQARMVVLMERIICR